MPPTATISTPASGGSYTVGQLVQTTFGCSEGAGGTGLASCNDSTSTNTKSDGRGHLDTSATGSHTYTVTAVSTDGLISMSTITYTVTLPIAAGAPLVRITNAKVSSTHRTAKFSFKGLGTANFLCALVKRKHGKYAKPSFSACHSPKVYVHLHPVHGQLRSAYQKLAISSRDQLADALAANKT